MAVLLSICFIMTPPVYEGPRYALHYACQFRTYSYMSTVYPTTLDWKPAQTALNEN